MEEFTKNQRIQYSQLTRFKQCYSGFPEGRLDFGDDPDLLVHTNEGTLGIEHTRIFRSDYWNKIVMQEQESLEQEIIDRAKEQYEASSGPALYVTVSFNPLMRLGKKNVNTLALSLTDIVSKYAPVIGEKITIETYDDYKQVLPSEIQVIFLDRYEKLKKNFWGVSRSAMVAKLTVENIEEIIQNKETRLEKYLRKCSKVWLLIVEDGSVPSSYFTISDMITTHIYKSRFDRIFLFRNSDCEAIELNIEP